MGSVSANAFFGTLIGTLSSLLILWMLTGVFRNAYPKKRSMRCRFIMNTSIFIFYLIFCIVESIISIYSLISSINNSFYVPWCQLRLHQMYGFVIAKILLYQFYIYQFHFVFKNSPFAISIRKLQLLGFIVSIPIICLTIISFYFTIEPTNYLSNPRNAASWNEMNIKSFNQCSLVYEYVESNTLIIAITKMCILLYVVNDIAFSIIILRLFLSRTLLYTLRLNEIESIHEGSADLVIKMTNLIILSVTTNYIVLIKYALNVDASIFTIDAFCNCLSIYLSYKFSSSLYNVLYKPCHSSCYGVCVKLCICCCLPKSLPSDKAVTTSHKPVMITLSEIPVKTQDRTDDTGVSTSDKLDSLHVSNAINIKSREHIPTTTAASTMNTTISESTAVGEPAFVRDPTPFGISMSKTLIRKQSF